ncbi:MAG: serine/threonine-protein kinase [Planctomycetota bacterium]|nr:serine/threonine-protein kinase [Planctomycetota bacterium]
MTVSQEARFEQYVLDRGLVTEAEMQEARRVLNQAEEQGKRLSLPDALIQVGALTRGQAQRVFGSLKGETVSPTIQIPGYQMMERVGRGSQAVVYKARQLSVDRVVAVKVLFSRAARDPEVRRRFVQEARAAAQLSHNNIVQAIDAGESEGYSYFVQEFIDGTTAFELLKLRSGPLPEEQALEIVTQIAEALAHAHSRGLIHRDVKPRNIMITKEGVAKLADMGLARFAGDAGAAQEETGKAFGTPFYIAPEQVQGSPNVNFRADIYSLGATFYEMLTGRPPYNAPTPQQVMQKHITGTLVPPDHVNPSLSAGVSEVVEVMMSKRPKDRYNTTEDLLEDLRAVAAGRPPRTAREKVGMGSELLEGLAGGEEIRPKTDEPPPAPSPFAINQLSIILLAALAVAVLVIIVMAVM